MATTLYQSTDAGAPVINGTTGSLTAALTTLLQGSGVAYTGKTAAGWTVPFTGTSKAVFQQGGGNGFCLRVQDDGPGAGTFKEARIVGYESMTTVDAGTNPFPTVAQFANGLFVRKSTTTDSTARDWVCIADDRTFYMFIKSEVAVSVSGVYYGFGFGDFYSNLATDGYRTFIQGRATENSNATTSLLGSLAFMSQTIGTASPGFYVARDRNGTVGALNVSRCSPALGYNNQMLSSGQTGASTMPAYPNGEDGGLYLEPILMGDGTTSPSPSVRGLQRGIWYVNHAAGSFSNGDRFSGVADFSGKTFFMLKQTDSPTSGVLALETTSAWVTSS